MNRPEAPRTRHGFPTGRAVYAVAPVVAAALAHIGPAATWLPELRRRRFPGLAGRGSPGHVALTFDDGPDPASTPRFLDTLDGLGVRATFFVLGENALRHPALTRELVRRGHELAVHGWTHDRPWWPSPARDTRELLRAVRVVDEVSGRAPRWYRPPYGILTSGRWAAARRAGLRPVLWTAGQGLAARRHARLGTRDRRGRSVRGWHGPPPRHRPRLRPGQLAGYARRAAGHRARLPRGGAGGGPAGRARRGWGHGNAGNGSGGGDRGDGGDGGVVSVTGAGIAVAS